MCGLVLALVMFVFWDERVRRGFIQLRLHVSCLMYALCIQGKDNINIVSFTNRLLLNHKSCAVYCN